MHYWFVHTGIQQNLYICIKITLGTNGMWSVYTVALIYRLNNIESILLATCKMCSLEAGGLYLQVLFREGLTVFH